MSGKRKVQPAATAPAGVETDIKAPQWWEAIQALIAEYQASKLTIDEVLDAISALADAALLDAEAARQRAEAGK